MTYVIVQEGVYRHEIRGGFETFEAAKAAAEAQCRLEKDDYHIWTVLEVSPTAERTLGGWQRKCLNSDEFDQWCRSSIEHRFKVHMRKLFGEPEWSEE